jgi:hypothetical protein
VNAPRVWPNSSASTSSSAIAAQLSAQNRRPRRMLASCTARATSSLPDPLSPSIKTGNGDAAACMTARRTSLIALLSPTKSGTSAACACGTFNRSRTS